MLQKVSVIMGVYNTNDRKILEIAIDSILSQTLANLELIICDDGSTDGTLQTLKSIVAERIGAPIVLVCNEINCGVAASRNRCIEIAHGEYIALQDCDDWSDASRLEKQAKFLDLNVKYAFVSARCYLVEQDSFRKPDFYIEKPMITDMLYTLPFTHSASMFRRDAILALGGYRIAKETKYRSEDYDLFLRLYAMGLTGYVLNEFLYYYRLNINTKRKNKLSHCWHESTVRYKGFYANGLLPRYWYYVVKPVIAWIIPKGIFLRIQKKRGLR